MDNLSSPLSSNPRLTSSEPQPTNIHPPALPSSQKHHSRPLSEIIGETFPPFDHQANIVKPFNDETNRDLVFERGLSFTLLNGARWTSYTRKSHYEIDSDLYLVSVYV
jgi:hypothetical protein